MSLRRTRDPAKAAPTGPAPELDGTSPASIPPHLESPAHSGLAQRRAGPHSREEAEDRYVEARDAWTAAMRRANSGRSADLASLAIAQEAYEAAAAEVERWRSGARVAIPIVREPSRGDVEAAVGQELAWRRVRDHEEQRPGLLRRWFGRLRGKG